MDLFSINTPAYYTKLYDDEDDIVIVDDFTPPIKVIPKPPKVDMTWYQWVMRALNFKVFENQQWTIGDFFFIFLFAYIVYLIIIFFVKVFKNQTLMSSVRQIALNKNLASINFETEHVNEEKILKMDMQTLR